VSTEGNGFSSQTWTVIQCRSMNSATRPFSRKERSGWADSHFEIGEKTPRLLVFLSTNHNRSGRCHSNGALAKILPGGNRFWCNSPTKISPTGREPRQKNGYIPARSNTAKVSKGHVENG
ncbi:hypothetical protein P3389_34380, partial [Vibrio parahaemolyticus]|nr:hypothetical protein [Vibrio parahaemolyticus]